jgi:hypothetical protein
MYEHRTEQRSSAGALLLMIGINFYTNVGKPALERNCDVAIGRAAF